MRFTLIAAAATCAFAITPAAAQDKLNTRSGAEAEAPVAAAPQAPPDEYTPGDPAQFGAIRRLNSEVIAADADIKARNDAERDRYRAETAAYERKLAEQRAAEAEYQRKLAEQQAARARYEAEVAAWRVEACKAGDRSQCR